MVREVTTPAQNEHQLEILDSIDLEHHEQAVGRKSLERLQLLWDQRRFLMRTAAIGLVAATVLAFLIPKRFTSTAGLMPPDQGPGSNGLAMMAALAGKAGGSLGSVGSELLGLKTTGDLFIGILQSRTVNDDVIGRFGLRKVYGVKRWEDARKELTKRTSFSQDRKSELITISVTDGSAQRAQRMTQEYIEQLNNVVTTLNTTSAHRERVFLEGRLNQVQHDLESAEKDFSQFASRNTTIDIEAQGKAMIEAGATLQGQLIAAQAELEGLRQIFTDSNVRVRETQARIDELNRQLRKLGGKSEADVTGPQDGSTLYPSIRQLPVLGVPYADLYRRMKVQEAVFETLTQQYELAKVEEAKETPSVKVLDPPDLPEKKSFPPRVVIVLVGTMLACMFAVAWVLAHRAWDAIESTDARKIFAYQVWGDMRAGLPAILTNGHHTVTRTRAVLDCVTEDGYRKESEQTDDPAGTGRQE